MGVTPGGAQGAEARQAGLLDCPFRLLGPAPAGELVTHDLPIVAVDDGRQTELCSLQSMSRVLDLRKLLTNMFSERDKHRFVAPMEAYGDGSWTDEYQLYVVGTLIAPKDTWAEFQGKWEEVLHDADPALELFHRADLYSRYVKPYCDWSDEKRGQVLADLARTIGTYADFGAAGVLVKPEWDLFCQQNGRPLGVTPYELCADACIGFNSRWLEENEMGEERIAYFFEVGDTEHGGSGQFKESVGRILGKSRRYGDEQRILAVSFVSKREALVLQATDLLVYELAHCRADRGEATEMLRYLADNFPILPIYFTYDRLHDLAARYTPTLDREIRVAYTLGRKQKKRRPSTPPDQA